MEIKRRTLHSLIPVFVAILASAIFLKPILFEDKLFFTIGIGASDILQQSLPASVSYSNALVQNKIPIWEPRILAGFPLMAEGQVGAFYPINLILYRLLPAVTAFNYNYFIHFFLLFIFTFLFSRQIKISFLGSLFTSSVFSFSGFFLTHIQHSNIFNAAVWLPLQFYLFNKLFNVVKKKSSLLVILRWGILLGIIFAIQFLAGSPQIVLYSLSGLFIWFCFLFVRNVLLVKENFKGSLVISICIFLTAAFFSVALSAIQLLPSVELVQNSSRQQGLSKEAILEYPHPPKHLLTFLWPYIFGDPANDTYPPPGKDWGLFWENTGYIGILPLLFAFLAICTFILSRRRRTPIVFFFILLLIISIVLTLGKYTPFYRIFLLPPYKFFRVPSRFLLLTDFSLAILAGLGFDWLYKKYLKKVPNSLFTLFFVCLMFLSFFDLFLFHRRFNPAIDRKKFLEEPETATFLKSQEGVFRYFSPEAFYYWNVIYEKNGGWEKSVEPFLAQKELLAEKINLLYGIESEFGVAGLYPNNSTIYRQVATSGDVGTEVALKFLGAENVKYIITLDEDIRNILPEVFQTKNALGDNIYIFENPYFLPRAYFVTQTKLVEKSEDFFQMVENGKLDLSKTVALKESVTWGRGEEANFNISLMNYFPERETFFVETDKDGFLVLLDSFYPGWKAFIDGNQTKLYSANVKFRAIKLASGRHKVEFVFFPDSYRIGKGLSLAAFFCLIPYLVYNLKMKKGWQKHNG